MTEVEKALVILKEKGFKMTPKRQAMLELIANSGRFISAKEVQEALKTTYSGLSYDTVYRNLYTFVELGILEMSERNGEKIFLMHCSKHHHHHHFICEKCQKITELHDCPMDVFEKQLKGYQILGHRFEIVGLCPACRDKKPKKDVSQSHCSCGHH